MMYTYLYVCVYIYTHTIFTYIVVNFVYNFHKICMFCFSKLESQEEQVKG